MPITLLAIANWLHLLATVVWIGGIVVQRLIVAPAVRKLPQATQRQALRAIEQRAASFTYGAIGVFFITGLTMMSQNANYAGVLIFENLWTRIIVVKHLVVVLLVVSTAYLNTAVNRRLQTDDEAEYARWAERQNDIADVNLLLGVVILGLTAIATAIPAGG
jgi:uncharacterized membrane protein